MLLITYFHHVRKIQIQDLRVMKLTLSKTCLTITQKLNRETVMIVNLAISWEVEEVVLDLDQVGYKELSDKIR